MSATLYNSDICEYTQADTNRCSFFIIMYQIKNIVIIFFLDACSCRSNSPISESTGKSPFGQCTFGKILHHSRKSFLTLAGNSSWLQTRIKIPISPHLPWMTLPGVHWTFLMISSSNNLGLKMVEVHADLNPCAKDGTASLSLPIRRGKGNGWFWISEVSFIWAMFI